MTASSPPQGPATASAIRAIVGPLDDRAVLEILALGASEAEVLQACAWRDARASRAVPGEYELHGAAARVFEVLEREELPPEADRA